MKALSGREQQLLKLIVEQYIQEGRPVASKSLIDHCRLDVSSATVRHVMADLEKQGLLCSPHTSSGRVPTPEGYRLFVNQLLTVQPLAQEMLHEFEQHFDPAQNRQALLQSTTSLLSSLSHLAGIVTLPKMSHQILSHIEFLPLSDGKVLVILVLNEKEVQNRIIEPDQHLTESILIKFGNFLTQHYAGLELKTIRQRLADDLQAQEEELSVLKQHLGDIFMPEAEDLSEYHIIGKTNLLPLADEVGVDALQHLFESLKEKQSMLGLFDNCLQADGVHIYIGEESNEYGLGGCSMVTATYHIDAEPVGILGVIGPNRMHYETVIPLVDITAQIISTALK